MYPNSILCPRAAQVLDQISNDPVYVQYMNSQQPLLENLSNILNIPLDQMPDWDGLFILRIALRRLADACHIGLLDAFEVMTCYDQDYPEGITDEMVQQIFTNANWQWNYQLNNTELVTLQYDFTIFGIYI